MAPCRAPLSLSPEVSSFLDCKPLPLGSRLTTSVCGVPAFSIPLDVPWGSAAVPQPQRAHLQQAEPLEQSEHAESICVTSFRVTPSFLLSPSLLLLPLRLEAPSLPLSLLLLCSPFAIPCKDLFFLLPCQGASLLLDFPLLFCFVPAFPPGFSHLLCALSLSDTIFPSHCSPSISLLTLGSVQGRKLDPPHPIAGHGVCSW